jgi:hypothetical protein
LQLIEDEGSLRKILAEVDNVVARDGLRIDMEAAKIWDEWFGALNDIAQWYLGMMPGNDGSIVCSSWYVGII